MWTLSHERGVGVEVKQKRQGTKPVSTGEAASSGGPKYHSQKVVESRLRNQNQLVQIPVLPLTLGDFAALACVWIL